MSRRFPPPLFGIEQTEKRSEVFVSLAIDAEESLEKTAFITRARHRLRKPDTEERYSESYVRRIVSTYIQLGVLRHRSDGTITVWQFARDWYADEIDFETFLWYGLKRSWVLDGRFPEGIDGLRSMMRVLVNAETPLERGALRNRLAATFDYEFNDQGIRGYPELLQQLGAIIETEDGYAPSERADRWRDRFRNVDLLPAFEHWLKQEGPHVDPPPDRVKRDLVKYYIYRESGGHGQHRRLFDTFRKDYLKATAYKNDVSEPKVRRAEQYVDAENHRRALRDEIRERFESFTTDALSGLSTDVLQRIADAADEADAYRIKSSAGAGLSRADFERWDSSDRPPYSFPADFERYDWQREAADAWFEPATHSDRLAETGITKVVTGAGKTVMALDVIKRWVEKHPDGVVTVIVPTNVLMRQWLEELVEKLNAPTDDIGWAGGGHKDRFDDGYRILVSIVNSAVKDDFLQDTLDAAEADEHLLIADECHRYTGETFSNVFDYPRTASLGLSATPLSNPGSDEHSESDEVLLTELGPIYYTLTYEDGIDRNLIPEFHVNYVGFDLTDAERQTYDRLSEQVADAVSDIETRYGNRLYELNGHFAHKLQTIADGTDGPTPAISDFFRYTRERREFVADAIDRQAITLSLLQKTINESKKSIVFQERINQLERMVAPAETRGRNYRTGEVAEEYGDRQRLHDQYPGLKTVDQELERLFFDADYRPVMYHSDHRSETWNDFAVEWFDDGGFANVMLSVKALIEGVDVPSADMGIVRVSSGSVRQRIQTFGRVLRTGGDPTATSELYVLYARNTVDEKIFREYDWEDQLAMADVSHLVWDPDGDWTTGEWDETASFRNCVREATADERPSPTTGVERPVPDPENLERGDAYPGPRDGYRFSVDSDGQPFEKTADGRTQIQHAGADEIAEYVSRRKGGGTVVVNEADHALMFVDEQPVFLGTLDPSEFQYADVASGSITDSPDEDELDGLL